MRFKSYLLQINPVLSRPEAARRLLRLFAIVLLIGIFSGVYTFLLSTFNNDISQRRGYMSSAIAEAHTFFTTREALLESLSLSAVRKSMQAKAQAYPASSEEQRLQLGSTPGNQWSIWLTSRMRNYLKVKQVNLLYVTAGPNPQLTRLYDSTAQVLPFSQCMLNRLRTLKKRNPVDPGELWLSDQSEGHSHLYLFILLDERDPNSGWLGLEMESHEVSMTLNDQSAGEFMMLNSKGMLVFTNSHEPQLNQSLLEPQGANFFGFVGSGLLPDHLVIRKQLKSSDWQLMYTINLRDVVRGLWRELLGSLAGAAEVPGSDDPGLGLLDRRQLRPVSAPVASGRHLGGADPVARAISALDDLAEAHRDVQVTVSTWQGASEVLLADLRFAPSPFHRRGSGGDADGGAGLLLPDVFGTWWEGRPPDCRHDPATDALHGLLAVRNVTDRRHAPGRAPSGWLDAAMAAEAGAPVGQLRHPALVRHVLEWMLVRDVRPATIDACLDGASNVFAAVPRQALEDLPEEGAPSNQRWAQDWRVHQRRLGTWGELLEGLRSLRPDVVSAAHLERWFQLMRWFDQPRPGVVRVPVPQALLLAAHAAGVASDADVLEALMQPRTRLLSDLSRWRRHQHEERNPGAVALADRVRQRVLAIEVHRGDLPTAASALALRLRSVEGVSTTAAVLGSLGAAALQRGWSADGISRQAVFSHLLRVSRPAEADRADDLVAAARDAGVRDRRLLELAVYAPQWAALVEQALGWPGLEDGVWWFHAHTKDDRWSVDADVRESWAARSAERTPLGADDLVAGGVDVAWFLRSHAELGEARWKQLHAAAKFASGGGGHRRAQLFAEAMLGLADEGALEGRIRTKRHQDSVRALGLLPLPAAEPDRAEASMRRYGTLREFERGAAKFGSMRQASERGAVRIGIENLARTAGSPDPQQFAWAMEAAEAGALADGPITVAEDDVAVTLSISPDGLAEIGVVRGNKALKAVPASHRKRPAIAELVARRTALARQARRVRASLEASMVRQDRFRTEDLVALDRHPVVAPMLELLVFVDEAGRTARRRAGQLIDAYGAELVPTGTLRIAHPVDLAGGGDWVRWQEQLYAEEARQPCKQVFRELYVVTAAERDGGPISHRYDGHQVQPRQALALLGSRGWLADRESGEVSRVFHDHGMVARLELLDGFGTPADVELPTISGIGFTERGSYLAQPLGSVAPVVLSEAMRDLDLVVSVAHAGAVDPEATASTVDVRAALVREAARTLRLDNVREVGSHVVIQGKLGEYSVHLGSGVVHRRPGGEVCIIPVDSQRRGRVFLPFADDDPKTAEVVAKVLLLARDHQIKDPSILEQLRT